MGYQVLTVARAAAQGATLHECKTLAEIARDKTGALFTVSTLEYLHRGGRIGGAAAFLGTTLDLKPILTLKEGKIEAMERVRTLSKASDRLVELFLEQAQGHHTVRLGILHAKAQDEGAALMKKVQDRLPTSMISEAILAEVSPVIGTHTGPGTIGIAYMLGM
jgi:DegV family protein with EDD domain